MSVAEALGLERGVASVALLEAGARWPALATREPVLRGVPDGALGVRSWSQARAAVGDFEAIDDVVAALGRLARRDGPTGEAATVVLAWAMLPGANDIAWALAWLGPEVDHIVGANLWIQCRSIPRHWQRKVAANVLRWVRTNSVADMDRGARWGDATWRRTVPVDPADAALWWEIPDQPAETVDELVRVLGWAQEMGVISAAEAHLLWGLVRAAGELTTVARARGGLLSLPVSARVAEEFGVSAVTVRRRAARAIDALSAAAATRGLAGAAS